MRNKNIANVSFNIVNKELIMGGVTTNLSYKINLINYNKLRHIKVVY